MIEEKTIVLQEKNVNYELNLSKRARRMKLVISCDGSFVVTSPTYIKQSAIEQFIINKSGWILDKISYFKSLGLTVFSKNAKNDYLRHKNNALVLTRQKIEQFNQIYKFEYNNISIKNQKSRWGSCSNKNNLNFNYKIALLPQELSDYIIVHELCHIREFNHSNKFWCLVQKTIPNYKDLKRKLRKYRI